LRNHGKRVGATRMQLIGLDGKVDGDTLNNESERRPFPFPDLLEAAAADQPATALAAEDGKAFWVVLVPVKAPIPIAHIGASIPLDNAMIEQLRLLSTLPREIALVTPDGTGPWRILASSVETPDLIAQLLPQGAPPPGSDPQLSPGRRDLIVATPLHTPDGGVPIVAVVGLSLDEALRQYDPIILRLVALLIAGLAVALAGTILIARSVARPIEALASVARRVAAGDYTPPPPLAQADEIGQLSAALGNMAVAISEREEHILHQATHDAVTGLPNRIALDDQMRADLAAVPDREASVLMIGLPRLQEIVNTLGHDFRDHLMRHVGERLLESVGSPGVVARVADIGFAVWCVDSSDSLDQAHRLADAVGEQFRQGDITIDVATAIGIAQAPRHGTDAGILLQRADIALHLALARADDRILVYDPATNPHRAERLTLMSDLREALDHDEMQLHYQPKIDLAAGRIGGAEALVRWTHAKRGFVPPDEFIQLAEETGNIRRLTQWGLSTAIAQAALWRGQGLKLRMSVNLSVRDLGDPRLPARVTDLLTAHAMPPDGIVLEITESAIMGEPETAIAVLKRLADRGIDLSIDDFGVGQSSFTYLRRLPVRELKIDKSFVLNLATRPDDVTIVRSIVELGHNLGYKVTAEGVEDSATMQILTDLSCDYGQGYYVAKALPAPRFEDFLATGRWPAKRMEPLR
jgi:diguanylate cyclase (GGDEF)-like protein